MSGTCKESLERRALAGQGRRAPTGPQASIPQASISQSTGWVTATRGTGSFLNIEPGMGRRSEGCAQIAMGINHQMEEIKVGLQGVHLPRADRVLG